MRRCWILSVAVFFGAKRLGNQFFHFMLAVTGDPMVAVSSIKPGFFCQTALNGKRTPGMKPTARRRISRVGHITA